ncbi:hypothetical protein F5148DRAFT_1203438 [Russula earlei]|uniref:Uncharacterized protein n=1 Tax=Russula earlei TaxID=71964 RepID=A0ACC0U854_9AGAM|nr:hypothetical protein F5148DRAFT_1203438 [Russula earlei]
MSPCALSSQRVTDPRILGLKEEDSSPSRNAYKIRSYQVAIAAIHQHNKPISSGKEATKIRGIGLGIANRIDFFLQGKEYDEESNKQAKARLQAVEAFQKIPGIGERTATNLVNAGAASMSDLLLPEFAALLTPNQIIGVRYGDHITRPTPRAEAEEIVVIHLTGAYRRESAELPGVSILLHHPQYIHVFTSVGQRKASPLLQDVVRPLESAGLLAATLSSGVRKWRGVAILPLRAHAGVCANSSNTAPGAWQKVGDRIRDIRATRGTYVRLDLSLAPFKSRGAAQIVLTGDEEFVRTARLAAARQGTYLDEYGLWRWHSSEEAAHETRIDAAAERRQNGGRAAAVGGSGYWELVEGESEDRILDELELGNIAPHRRNFRFLTSKRRASARAGTLDFNSALALEAKRWRENGIRQEDEDGDILAAAEPPPSDESSEER